MKGFLALLLVSVACLASVPESKAGDCFAGQCFTDVRVSGGVFLAAPRADVFLVSQPRSSVFVSTGLRSDVFVGAGRNVVAVGGGFRGSDVVVRQTGLFGRRVRVDVRR